MFNYDKDGKLVKVFGGPDNQLGQLSRRMVSGWMTATRISRCWWCAIAPTGGFSGSRSTARRFPQLKRGKVVLFLAHAKTAAIKLNVPDFARPRQPLRQGEQAHRSSSAMMRNGGKKVLDGFKIRTQPKERPAGKFVHPHDAAFDKGTAISSSWNGSVPDG